MNTNIRRFSLALLLVFLIASLGLTSSAVAQERQVETYRVTLTNLTLNQIISPPVLLTHNFGARLFLPGQPASDELAALAEDADISGLLEAFANNDAVFDVVVADDVLMPGQSVTLEITTSNRYRRLSAAGMLVTTNDAFFGLESLVLFGGARRKEAALPAYDSGTEANNELCDFIPGPPCGNPGVRDTDGAEGFIHVHPGMFGIGDLPEERYTWLNPTVLLRAVRVDP